MYDPCLFEDLEVAELAVVVFNDEFSRKYRDRLRLMVLRQVDEVMAYMPTDTTEFSFHDDEVKGEPCR